MSIPETGPRAGPAFTLIEVLVSLAIFAFTAVALGAAYMNVLTNYHAALQRPERDGVAALLRANLMTEPDRARAETGGDLPLPDRRTARWRAQIEETSIADLFTVELEWEIVEPGMPTAEPGRRTMMLLRPRWSDPTVRERLRAESRRRLADRRY